MLPTLFTLRAPCNSDMDSPLGGRRGGRFRAPPVAEKARKKEWQRSKKSRKRKSADFFGHRNRKRHEVTGGVGGRLGRLGTESMCEHIPVAQVGCCPTLRAMRARLKVVLSAPPTILLRKNANLLCGGIVRANFHKLARRRVLHQVISVTKCKKHPQGVLFAFGLCERFRCRVVHFR